MIALRLCQLGLEERCDRGGWLTLDISSPSPLTLNTLLLHKRSVYKFCMNQLLQFCFFLEEKNIVLVPKFAICEQRDSLLSHTFWMVI